MYVCVCVFLQDHPLDWWVHCWLVDHNVLQPWGGEWGAVHPWTPQDAPHPHGMSPSTRYSKVVDTHTHTQRKSLLCLSSLVSGSVWVKESKSRAVFVYLYLRWCFRRATRGRVGEKGIWGRGKRVETGAMTGGQVDVWMFVMIYPSLFIYDQMLH